MKRCCVFLTFALTAVALGGDADRKALDGTWKPASAEFAGMKLSDVELGAITLTMADGKYTVQAGKSVDKGTFKIDTAAKPKAIDIVGTEGPNKGKTLLAIYELDKDNLRVCYDLEGKKRPTDFTTSKEKPYFYIVYKRVK